MNGPQDEEEDFSKLTLDERLSHKSWKARLNGYQQLLKQFQNAFPLPQEYVKYWSDPSLFHKYILDGNVVAQENALFALHAMLKKQIPNVNPNFNLEAYLNEWVNPLLTKALNSSRSKSKDLSVTCILLICSLDQSIAAMVLTIIDILPSVRIPRLIAAIISCINNILTTFQLSNVEGGQLVELLNKIFVPLPKLASHADKNVRGNTMDLIVTLYVLLGKDQTLLQETLLDKLKPIQQRELDKKFNVVGLKMNDVSKDCETGEVIMFEWQKKIQEDVDEDGDTNMEINIPQPSSSTKIDPLHLLPEEDLLTNLPEEFYTRIKSAKWKDRVEVLEELNVEHLNKIKKLQIREDYGPLLKILSDIIHRDVNVQSVTLASDAVNQILRKLPKSAIHESYIAMVFPALLERTKERKPSVIEMITKTIHTVCGIYEPFLPGHESLILKDLLMKLNDRIPGVKLECSKIFNELLGCCEVMDKLYMIGNLIEGLKIQDTLRKLINDTQVNIRNVTFMIVAKLINLLGVEYFQDFLDKIDKLKRRKIESMVEGEEGKVKMRGSGQLKVKPVPQVTNSNKVIHSNNSRLNKIIPNKRVATSPAVKLQRSPVKLSTTSPHNDEVNKKLQTRVKELEMENLAYKNKINDLERAVNQHIQTIMIKDTEISKLKKQYEVMASVESSVPVKATNTSSNIIKSSPISRDLPNKVRRLQIDPVGNVASTQDVINTTMATEESWQRAAQVTQQLKDRINRMRNRK